MTALTSDPVSVTFSPSSDNVREVLGFLHYQVSQQSKEIAVLNRRVAQLMQSTHEQERVDFTVYINGCNQRMDTFTASIRSITEQVIQHEEVVRHHLNSFSASVRSDLNDKIQKLESKISQIQQAVDNTKVSAEVLDLRIAELKNQAKEQEKRNSDAFDQVQTDIAALKHGQPFVAHEILPADRKAASGKRSESSHRKHAKVIPRSSIESMEVVDVHPTPENVFGDLRSEILELKNLVYSGMVAQDQGQMGRELLTLNLRINDCATKADLYDVTQCFMAAGSEGVAEYILRKRGALTVVPSGGKQVARQTAAHVKVISGECLKRPVTNPNGKTGRARARSGEWDIM
jgi:hypothetical protein